jgi:hypothetical protein
MLLADAEQWTARAIGLATLLATIELLKIRRVMADDGVWSWPYLRREHVVLPTPLRLLFAALLPYRPFVALLWLRLPLALTLLCGSSLGAPLLLLTEVAIGVRFRGTFNGGSDYMNVLILLALSVARVAHSVPLVVTGCLAYVAAQAMLSYVIAGLAKLRDRAWRRGLALGALVADAGYGTPGWLRSILTRPSVSRVASWSVLLFECSFPASLKNPSVCAAFLAMGVLFHLGNSVIFGLNRFLFAWLAAYPSLLFVSQLLQI